MRTLLLLSVILGGCTEGDPPMEPRGCVQGDSVVRTEVRNGYTTCIVVTIPR